MQLCNKCILPINYQGITFNNNGVCNFCTNHERIEYAGADRLRNEILSHRSLNPNVKYDCAIGFSGGRDSSFLLYYLSKVLRLKVIAFTFDNGNIPPDTWFNIKNITKLLDVKLVIKKYCYLEKCFKNHFRAWLHNPSTSMISALCVGCRLGLAKGKYELLKEYKIPIFISGGTPFEGNGYKTNLLRYPINSSKAYSLILGYFFQVSQNMRWLHNPYSIMIQGKEFMAYYAKIYDKILKNKGYVTISPFWNYIKWEEQNIIDILKNELGWKQNSQMRSTWRGDCDISILKLYLYKIMLGYNDKDDSLSDLIRDGQLTRDEAMKRLETEQYISEDVIKNIVKRSGIDYIYFQNIMKDLNYRRKN